MTVKVNGVVPDWATSVQYDPRVAPIGIEMLIEHLNQLGLIENDHQEATLRGYAFGGELGHFLAENGVEWCLVRVGSEIRRASTLLIDACLYAANLGADKPVVFPLYVLRKEFLLRAEHSGAATEIKRQDCESPEIKLSKPSRISIPRAWLGHAGYIMVDYMLMSNEGARNGTIVLSGLISLVHTLSVRKK